MLFVNVYDKLFYCLKAIAFILWVLYYRGSLTKKTPIFVSNWHLFEPKYGLDNTNMKRPDLRDGLFLFIL